MQEATAHPLIVPLEDKSVPIGVLSEANQPIDILDATVSAYAFRITVMTCGYLAFSGCEPNSCPLSLAVRGCGKPTVVLSLSEGVGPGTARMKDVRSSGARSPYINIAVTCNSHSQYTVRTSNVNVNMIMLKTNPHELLANLHRSNPRLVRIAILCFVAISLLLGLRSAHASGYKIPSLPSSLRANRDASTTALKSWQKPEGFKIIGLVFYGRRKTMEVLDCYLQRNLVSNGGLLDEIHFVINTGQESDLEYLHNLTNSNELYRAVKVAEVQRSDNYQVPYPPVYFDDGN